MFYAKFIYDRALDNFSVGGRGQKQKSNRDFRDVYTLMGTDVLILSIQNVKIQTILLLIRVH